MTGSKHTMAALLPFITAITVILTPLANAEESGTDTTTQTGKVRILKSMPYAEFKYQGRTIRIERNQNQDNMITGGFAKTSRKCPPFCIKPISIPGGVSTVGELEVIQFMKTQLQRGTGVLIDARTPAWHAKGTIPGSVNIPFTIFSLPQDDIELIETLKIFGVVEKGPEPEAEPTLIEKIKAMFEEEKPPVVPSKWDFTQAKELVLWCNGIWCGQSPRAIKGLMKLGYPAEKLHWYRGGMQVWLILGLNIEVPGE